MSISSLRIASSALLVSIHLTSSALAAGFANPDQSVTGLGTANAGTAAGGEDASTMFFNPAGLSRLGGNQIVGGAVLVLPQSRFTNSGSFTGAGTPTTGPDGGNGGQDHALPHLYALWTVDRDLKLGLAVTSPYGIDTSYEDGWVGRYHAITSTLSTVNVQPTVAYRVNDRISLGAGLQFQHMQARLTNAIDFSTLCSASSRPSAVRSSGRPRRSWTAICA